MYGKALVKEGELYSEHFLSKIFPQKIVMDLKTVNTPYHTKDVKKTVRNFKII